MKIITYNINGIRAAFQKDFLGWVKSTKADILCLQEVKANTDQVDLSALEDLGYHIYWHAAQRKGYSGVAILSKQKPVHVEHGCGESKYDEEGRMLRIDFADLSVLTTYMPSGSSSEERQFFKLGWLEFFSDYAEKVQKDFSNLVINGDFNVCHQAIDIHNPIANRNTPGFTPEERAWFSSFLNLGYIDTFRHFTKDPHHYSWWSYRAGARRKNLGWRIDYQVVSEEMISRLKRCVHLPEAKHSDHCPVLLELH
ncbi:exodeoxyribonuclease III [Chryseotalea sanaruensis]|uniref:Exodeoxyribonuclease III n=1 Tax=Chryseotalea sanaruensis TaxID=2482724 RepID=A0A401U847_9BACT|nr:exodeoxyribonuclease III [Chryseotalea sanaruensis]GCC51059.1 exodeoxyribonuclease III [Chryseotalea sanaruensis]